MFVGEERGRGVYNGLVIVPRLSLTLSASKDSFSFCSILDFNSAKKFWLIIYKHTFHKWKTIILVLRATIFEVMVFFESLLLSKLVDILSSVKWLVYSLL